MRRYRKALGRERNKTLGACLLALADVRRKVPDLHVYDSYSDYVYEIRYGCDYTLEDVSQLCGVVKSEIAPLHDDCGMQVLITAPMMSWIIWRTALRRKYNLMCYIGYGTASLSELDLWTMSQKSRKVQ